MLWFYPPSVPLMGIVFCGLLYALLTKFWYRLHVCAVFVALFLFVGDKSRVMP